MVVDCSSGWISAHVFKNQQPLDFCEEVQHDHQSCGDRRMCLASSFHHSLDMIYLMMAIPETIFLKTCDFTHIVLQTKVTCFFDSFLITLVTSRPDFSCNSLSFICCSRVILPARFGRASSHGLGSTLKSQPLSNYM